MRRSLGRLTGACAAAAGLVLLPFAPAFADTTVTVRGTSFPADTAAQLSFVGCTDPYQRTADDLQPYVGIGPDRAPAGRRSLGYDLAGGNAIGSLHYVASVTATTVAGMSVYAADGAAGVSYFGYQAPADRGTGRVWFGRAELSVPAGGWTDVDARRLTFGWHQYDMVAMRPVDGAAADGGTATVTDFVASHGGDGPGFVTIGFGCDGRPFSMDAWRIGAPGSVTTYDLEGLATTTTIDGPSAPVAAGARVTLRGDVTVAGGDLGAARLVLERRTADGRWVIVQGVDTVAGEPVEVTVAPDHTTTYRWQLVDRPLAEGSTSAPFTVRVQGGASASPGDPAGDAPGDAAGGSTGPSPTAGPSATTTPPPSSGPGHQPTHHTTPAPHQTAPAPHHTTPTAQPPAQPTAPPTAPPAAQPSSGPTDAPVPTAGLSAGADASPSATISGSAAPTP